MLIFDQVVLIFDEFSPCWDAAISLLSYNLLFKLGYYGVLVSESQLISVKVAGKRRSAWLKLVHLILV